MNDVAESNYRPDESWRALIDSLKRWSWAISAASSAYVVAMIELEEGPLMMGNVTGCDVGEVMVGMPVEVYVVQAAEGIGVPFWRPVAT